MLLPRFMTAVVGSFVLISTIYFGGYAFFFIVLGLILLGIREFYYLARETGYPAFVWIGQIGSAMLAVSVYLNGVSFGQVTENQLTSALIGFLLIVIICRSVWKGPSDTSLSEWGVTLLGIMYVSWTLSHLFLIRDLRIQGRELTFLLVFSIWAADTLAYVVGVRWGSHRIASAISPKKTWEGTIAGILASMTVVVLFQLTIMRTSLGISEALALGFLIGLLAFISDLAESILKRGAGVKDSSPLLPGHGGILDRFDSFILTAPFFYYYWVAAHY